MPVSAAVVICKLRVTVVSLASIILFLCFELFHLEYNRLTKKTITGLPGVIYLFNHVRIVIQVHYMYSLG